VLIKKQYSNFITIKSPKNKTMIENKPACSANKEHKSIKFSFGGPMKQQPRNQNGVVVALTACPAIVVVYAKKMGWNKSTFVYALKELWNTDPEQCAVVSGATGWFPRLDRNSSKNCF